jgi:type VI protein secretion system component VasK
LHKNSLNKDIVRHIQNALQAPSTKLLNTKLIRQTRKTLNLLSDKELAYILLMNMSNNNVDVEINLGTNIGTPPALISKGTATLIPQLFTVDAFNQVIKEQIPLAAQAAIKGNEVLGKKSIVNDSIVSESAIISALAEQLEKTYLSHYIDIWESLVDNISLNTPRNLTETDAMIMNLISNHSPLLQLLQAIHHNTNLEPILTSSYKLQALNTLFDQTQSKQKDSLYQIFMDLHQLHLFLQQASTVPVSKDKTEEKQTIINQILSMAEKYPEPIKNWLLSLVSFTQNQLQAEIKPNAAVEQKPVVVLTSPAPTSTKHS